jgi:uncharacterized protein (TIGR02118 family)
MSISLIALWNKPGDVEAFEKHYHQTHMPLARKLPGLKSAETYKTQGDGPYYRLAVLHFDGPDALGAAMGSPEGAALMEDTQKLGTLDTLVVEDD